MPRTILVHLNVEVPDDDPRTPDQIALNVVNAFDVGNDPHYVGDLSVVVNPDDLPAEVTIPLVEEV